MFLLPTAAAHDGRQGALRPHGRSAARERRPTGRAEMGSTLPSELGHGPLIMGGSGRRQLGSSCGKARYRQPRRRGPIRCLRAVISGLCAPSLSCREGCEDIQAPFPRNLHGGERLHILRHRAARGAGSALAWAQPSGPCTSRCRGNAGPGGLREAGQCSLERPRAPHLLPREYAEWFSVSLHPCSHRVRQFSKFTKLCHAS